MAGLTLALWPPVRWHQGCEASVSGRNLPGAQRTRTAILPEYLQQVVARWPPVFRAGQAGGAVRR